jgi:hypothetical protein
VPWLAAAACLALALFTMVPTGVPSLAEDHRIIAARSGVTPLSWTSTEGSPITGDVVWDNATQTGVMRFRGLAANDPTKLQYQLWIFDESRKEQGHPAVDGGVFDIQQAGEDTYVRIDSKLEVVEPYLFAITTEPPGGVVEHVDRDEFRIVLTAAVAH